jgi:succinoglycan biosynthesis transport protein ExoP
MERTYTFDELLGSLRRRWKRAAIVTGVVFALAALVIARLPNEYRARALVMVEPLHPHPDLVTPVLGALEDQVKSVRSQIYARGALSLVIDELHLYAKEREKGGMDGAVEALRNDLEVRAEGDSAFAIVVKSRDPAQAADIANRLAELYIEGNLQIRAGQMSRTREIISSKLSELTGQLQKSEQKVTEFKEAHSGALPELLEPMMREREQLAKQIEVETGFMASAQTRLDMLGTQPYGKDTEVGRLEDEEAAVKARYSATAAGLQATHPDVQRLQREFAAVHEKLQGARARASANTLEQRRLDSAVERGRRSIVAIQARIAGVDKRVATIPGNGARLSELSRDIDGLKAKVQHLISKKAEIEVASELEHRQASSEFRVLESAAMPTLPASPNRAQALLIALLAALGLGISLAVAQEMSDRTLRNEAEAGAAIALPILASVPRILETRASGAVLALPPVRG